MSLNIKNDKKKVENQQNKSNIKKKKKMKHTQNDHLTWCHSCKLK